MSNQVPVRHAARIAKHSKLRIVAITLSALVLFSGTAVAIVYDRVMGNVDVQDVKPLLGTRPTKPTQQDPTDGFSGQALNLLIIGSDSREGENSGVVNDATEGMRSDTQIIMHISKDRKRIEMVSIPRDSWVEIPECVLPDGRKSRVQSSKFNAAFAIGGQYGVNYAAGCAITTVEKLTGVYIDGYVVVDFTGFERMVNALDGVPFCIPQDIVSKKAKLNIAAGYHTLDGETALKYARARTGKGLGDGSDLRRIDRQQELLAAMVNKAMSMNLLTNAPQLLQFLESFTGSLTMSPELASARELTGLAWALKDIRTSNIAFFTVPNRGRPGDPANVIWTKDADAVWDALSHDRPVVQALEPEPTEPPVSTIGPTTPATPGDSATSTPTPSPSPSLNIDVITPDDLPDVCA